MWNDLGEDVSDEERDRLMQPAAPVEGGSSVRVVQHRPDQDGDDNIENLYLDCVRSSTTSITIENAYFMPSDELKMELIAAAKRGVRVRVMTNSRESNDAKPVADAARFFYDDLAAAGVEIFEKQGGTLHAKTAAFDGAYSIVGSANLNSRSREHDAEIVLGVQDPGVAAQLEGRFEKGLEETVPVTMKELAAEGLGDDARQRLSSLASGVM
jgi:cardiolipin synthase